MRGSEIRTAEIAVGRASGSVSSVTLPGNRISSGRHPGETSVMQKAQAMECCVPALKRRESNAFQPSSGANPGED
jgi:hypothetical protein